MCSSEHYWWNDTDQARKEIIEYLEYLNPEEARKEYEKMKNEEVISESLDVNVEE